jgi:hypothetical protein
MREFRKYFFVVSVVLLGSQWAAAEQMSISVEDLRDKVSGGWAGQMIGVSFGAPTEFRYLNRIIPENELPVWKPEMIREALNQDDLYVDITFAAALDEHGLDASTADFAAMFRDTEFALWHANLAARRALRRGVPGELSGTPEYNIHANDIDFQIEADFVGLMTPGLPREANDIGFRAGRVMNYGDGIYGGLFVSGMYAAAFFETDPRAIVEAGLAVLPNESSYAQVIADLLVWHEEHSSDWQHVWHLLESKWNRNEVCPSGAHDPFNIDAKLNGAYVALGLLYGDGDFEKTMLISTRAGQDSDCNPSSAVGILGVVLGFEGIPAKYTSGFEAIADEKFNYTDYSFNDIVDSTVTRAVALIEQTGGVVADGVTTVKTQSPEAAPFEAWDDYGVLKEHIEFEDDRWRWSGDWQRTAIMLWRSERVSNISGEKGAEAAISFEGTGASVTGILLPNGGRAEVWLNEKLVQTIDVYPDEQMAKASESIWHAFGLEDKRHDLRIVVLGEPYGASTGPDISITGLLVFE